MEMQVDPEQLNSFLALKTAMAVFFVKYVSLTILNVEGSIANSGTEGLGFGSSLRRGGNFNLLPPYFKYFISKVT